MEGGGTRKPRVPVNRATVKLRRRPPSSQQRTTEHDRSLDVLSKSGYTNSEIVLGFVGAAGTDLDSIAKAFSDRFKLAGYIGHNVKISQAVIGHIPDANPPGELPFGEHDEFDRIWHAMDRGTQARVSDPSVLALGTAAEIARIRDCNHGKFERRVFNVLSLKHPAEVDCLRAVYHRGFYLVGVFASEKRRLNNLKARGITESKASKLMERDENENIPHGQRTSDTFFQSDFFLLDDGDKDQIEQSVARVVDLLLGSPTITPNFDEYAMFLAFSASLRSGDLSRQVGAVLAKGREIVSTGANDCPKTGGGLYWPEYVAERKGFVDQDRGRDFTRGEDSNKVAQSQMVDSVMASIKKLSKSSRDLVKKSLVDCGIAELTEFGRMVHAEMEAILACGRLGQSTENGDLFCTTFPCHNCAKHIVAAGIRRVVYIEPYPKSRALKMHDDSIEHCDPRSGRKDGKVVFEPFVGVGPRRFFDLFSMKLSSGRPLQRKDSDGRVLNWTISSAMLRVPLVPVAYPEIEVDAAARFGHYVAELGRAQKGGRNGQRQ